MLKVNLTFGFYSLYAKFYIVDSALSASEYVKQSRLDGGTEASNLLKAMKDYRPPRSAPRFRRDDSDSDDSS